MMARRRVPFLFYAAVLSRLIPTREMRLLGRVQPQGRAYAVSVLGTIAHDLLSFWAFDPTAK
jgi:hypothetical protein